jgi:cation diffusion facilitator family transporter
MIGPVHPAEGSEPSGSPSESLLRFAWLSVAAAVVTIVLKTGAWLLTDSVGLLSDAAESGVNLVAAVVTLIALRVAARPADAGHHFGHGKAEYFSAAVEGLLIFVAAGVILVMAVNRFLDPVPLENVGVGLVVCVLASVVNGVVGLLLIRTGRARGSAALLADGKHLMTDVWTSVGVVVGVLLVAVTGIDRLDPVIAAVVGVNIMVTGAGLVRRSLNALLDSALPPEDIRTVLSVLEGFRGPHVDFHALQTRESGQYRFVSVHLLVPGDWPVQRAHDLAEDVEVTIRRALPRTTVQTHIEPREDTRSYADHSYDARDDVP